MGRRVSVNRKPDYDGLTHDELGDEYWERVEISHIKTENVLMREQIKRMNEKYRDKPSRDREEYHRDILYLIQEVKDYKKKKEAEQSELFGAKEKEIDELKQKIAELSKRNDYLKDEFESDRRSIKYLSGRVTKLTKQNKKLKEKLENLKSPTKRRNIDYDGFVYVLNEINGSHYKIGRTKNPESRLKTFLNKLPYRVEYDLLIKTEDMYDLESKLHDHFSDKRVDGEWFELSQADINWIRDEFKGED